MLNTGHTEMQERLVGDAVRGLLAELRLVDVADLLAFARLGHHEAIRDIVRNAAGLHFAPGFIDLEGHANAVIDWHRTPEVELRLSMRAVGIGVHFTVRLSGDEAQVRLTWIEFARNDLPEADRDKNLRRIIADNRMPPASSPSSAV